MNFRFVVSENVVYFAVWWAGGWPNKRQDNAPHPLRYVFVLDDYYAYV